MTTGSRFTLHWYISRAALVTGSPGVMVTGGWVIRSAAVSAAALANSPPPASDGSGPSVATRASLDSRSASDTTPATRPSSSRTGKALTRNCVSRAAMALNGTVFLTATTRLVITSPTAVLVMSPAHRGVAAGYHRRRSRDQVTLRPGRGELAGARTTVRSAP